MLKSKIKEEYVQMDQVDWKPFPAAFSTGGIRWKLLHVSPEMGSWTAIFDCPAGSSFAASQGSESSIARLRAAFVYHRPPALSPRPSNRNWLPGMFTWPISMHWRAPSPTG